MASVIELHAREEKLEFLSPGGGGGGGGEYGGFEWEVEESCTQENKKTT